MDKAIVYYSFGGSTAKYAKEQAKQRGIDCIEMKEAKKRTIFGAFFKGCPMAMRQQPSVLKEPVPDLSQYKSIIIACPVWAGFPAPAFYAILNKIPSGTSVEIHLMSGGGETSKSHDAIVQKIQSLGLNLVDYIDIKSPQQ